MLGCIHRLGLAAVLAGVWALTACDNTARQANMVIVFSAPVQYRAIEGDTLASVADTYSVRQADLAEWNGKEDALEPGDVLFIWPVPSEEEEKARAEAILASAAPPPRSGPRRTGRKARPSPRPTPRPRSGETAPAVPAAPAPAPRDAAGRPTSVRNAGLFGAGIDDGGELNDGLASAVDGLQHDRRDMGTAGLRDGTDMRGGTAESAGELGRVARPPPRSGPYFPDTPIRTPSVRRPTPKRCLRQRTAANTGDDGMYGGKGLSSAQIRGGLSSRLSLTRRCMPAGTDGKFGIIVEINVGCDGRVKNIYPINRGGLPKRILSCIETVLGSASFPAHDLPDGQSFQYPIDYNF